MHKYCFKCELNVISCSISMFSVVINILWHRSYQIAFSEWNFRLKAPTAGVQTIGVLQSAAGQWSERRHGTLSIRLLATFFGTTAGCGKYLYSVAGMKLAESHLLGTTANAAGKRRNSTLNLCPAMEVQPRHLAAIIRLDLLLLAVVQTMANIAWTTRPQPNITNISL